MREIREAERNVRGGKEREREKSMDERKMRKFKKTGGDDRTEGGKRGDGRVWDRTLYNNNAVVF